MKVVMIWLLLSGIPMTGAYSFGQKKKAPKPKEIVAVSLSSSLTKIVLCPTGFMALVGECTEPRLTLAANATNPKHELLTYEWIVTAGRLSGNGPSVKWDLTGVPLGQYKATVLVKGDRSEGSAEVTVSIEECGSCQLSSVPCPMVTVSCPADVQSSEAVVFSVNVSGYPEWVFSPSFKWSVTRGKIVSGQLTRKVTVNTKDLGDESMTATVEVGGFDPACSTTASCTINIK